MVDDSVISLTAIALTALLIWVLGSLGLLSQPGIAEFGPAVLGSGTSDTAALDEYGIDGATAPSTAPSGSTTTTTGAPAVFSDWMSKLGMKHPLVGTIWSPDRQQAVTPAALAREITRADIILLGEIHDNADHHRLQAWLIGELVRKGRKPSIVLEMVGAEQSKALSNYLGKLGATAEGLGEALNWNSQWPDWRIFQPIAEKAMAHNLPILAGDAEAPKLDLVSRGGLRVLSESERSRIALGVPMNAELTGALAEEVRQAHCNLIPEDDIPNMTQVQRYRDAVMADSVLAAAAKSNGGVVLITGNGHARTDRGVPFYLRSRAPQYRVLSIAMMEVEDGARDANKLVPMSPEGQPAADFVWYTPRAEREDQCEALKAQLKKSSG